MLREDIDSLFYPDKDAKEVMINVDHFMLVSYFEDVGVKVAVLSLTLNKMFANKKNPMVQKKAIPFIVLRQM